MPNPGEDRAHPLFVDIVHPGENGNNPSFVKVVGSVGTQEERRAWEYKVVDRFVDQDQLTDLGRVGQNWDLVCFAPDGRMIFKKVI
jgi:hypothetical protein